MLKVKLIRSFIGASPKQRDTLKALGFKRVHQERELPDNDAIRGMIQYVSHMVEVITS